MQQAVVTSSRRVPCVRQVRGPAQLVRSLKERLHTLLSGDDAVADADDWGPFFALHFLQIPVQLARIIASGKPWIKIDLCRHAPALFYPVLLPNAAAGAVVLPRLLQVQHT